MSPKGFFNISNRLGYLKNYHRLKDEGSDFWFAKPSEKLYAPLERVQLNLIVLILALFFIIVVARSFWLQIVNGQTYNLIADENRLRTQLVAADRGIIYDRFGQPLVENIPHYALYFTPADLPAEAQEQSQLARTLAALIGKDQEQLLNIFTSADQASYTAVLLADNLSPSAAVALAAREADLPAVFLLADPERRYVESRGLAHLLGYVGRISPEELADLKNRGYTLHDYLGKNGLEAEYEDVLRGVNGYRQLEVDASGRPLKMLREAEPRSGSGLITTLNLELQDKLAASLGKAIAATPSATGGAAVAIEPSSGEILAMVSLPDFDNNFFSAGIQPEAYEKYLNNPAKPLFNRALSGAYPPGSIFKPLVALAALEEGIVDAHKTFLSSGGLQIDRWFFPDWKAGGHGRINVIRALADSVNTFFYYIGGGYSDFTGLGLEKIVAYAEKFNLSRRLGIDLPGEAAGFLPSRQWKEQVKGEAWYIGDTYHLAIGQGDVLVTPLQVASYTAAIANGGHLYQPHLAKGFKLNSAVRQTDKLAKKDYLIREDFISPANIEIVRQGLRETVVSGSARSLNRLPVPVAGKTGTAQVGGGAESHAWFTGFAPFDAPQVVLTVLIEHGGEGSRSAVPVFREAMDWYFSDNN